MIGRLDHPIWFPDPREARRDGLVAVGGDFSVERLLLAYRSGIFPWTASPVSWWSPDPRAVFEFGGFHISRSLERSLRRGGFEVTFDRDFPAVIRACAAAPRAEGSTWISPEFIAAYTALHRAGHAHSVEVWRAGELIGGVYGVTVGGLFAGESMFHRATDASKVALVHLVKRLEERGFTLFDTQMVTPVTRSLGAVEIPRAEYLRRLAEAVPLRRRFT
jgi:leucyl/phenylalanyl-tRNA---protein transferase